MAPAFGYLPLSIIGSRVDVPGKSQVNPYRCAAAIAAAQRGRLV
jgi:hypothetical protein